MPNYEFRCRCGHQFEQDFPFKDMVDYLRCPKCGRFAKRKLTPIIHLWKEGQKP